ncbi:hypothetical protein [Sphingopyxis sp. GC21]|uniref:hypothetical protein n=1 Tax=Sphingopyxis sp. GC21 TaxID=2933562 RepID=UPI003990296B
MKGKKRCRMHGGAKGSGAQPGNRNAVTHGMRTASFLSRRAQVRSLIAGAKDLIAMTDKR